MSNSPRDEAQQSPASEMHHLSRAERRAAGRAARSRKPLVSQAELSDAGRADPVALLESQSSSRVPDLVPIRYGRMLASAFSFYRGGALLMATDLARTAHSGLQVQLCGDAHLSNFGVFATPERRLVFDVNDFDETHPGPFEWDVKRLVASLAVAGRENGFSAKKRRVVELAAAAGYRMAMARFASLGNLTVWYAHLDMDELMRTAGSHLGTKRTTRAKTALDAARGRDNLQALAKLTTMVDGHPKIANRPPLLVPLEDLWGADQAAAATANLHQLVRSYRRTLQPDRRHLLEGYRLTQVARKVVGVGSVGTRAWILLFEGIDGADPLFLQAKEAQASVLSGFVKSIGYKNQGERVVAGQHLMQAASDIFLGWQRAAGPDHDERDFYLRQLRDGKGSAVVEDMNPRSMATYGHYCGQVLARAHARSGDRVAISAYLGSKPHFDEAVAEFAEAYADINALDHKALQAAAAAGAVTAVTGK